MTVGKLALCYLNYTLLLARVAFYLKDFCKVNLLYMYYLLRVNIIIISTFRTR